MQHTPHHHHAILRANHGAVVVTYFQSEHRSPHFVRQNQNTEEIERQGQRVSSLITSRPIYACLCCSNDTPLFFFSTHTHEFDGEFDGFMGRKVGENIPSPHRKIKVPPPILSRVWIGQRSLNLQTVSSRRSTRNSRRKIYGRI